MPERIVKEFEFEAAHRLPLHEGKCRGLHGHNYLLKVGVSGELNEQGMIVDFYHLEKTITALITDQLDHKYLNKSTEEDTGSGFPSDCPTVEKLGKWIVNELKRVAPRYNITYLLLQETPGAYWEWWV